MTRVHILFDGPNGYAGRLLARRAATPLLGLNMNAFASRPGLPDAADRIRCFSALPLAEIVDEGFEAFAE